MLGFANAIHRTQQKDDELRAEKERLEFDRLVLKKNGLEQLRTKSTSQIRTLKNDFESDNELVRISALCELETLAVHIKQELAADVLQDDEKTYEVLLTSILNLLIAYIRTNITKAHTGRPKGEFIKKDIQEALRIIARTFQLSVREGINYPNLDFTEMNFNGLSLPTGAELSGIDFSKSSFLHSKMSGVILSECNLNRSVLTQADLSYVNFSKATVFDADFSDTELMGANFSDVKGQLKKQLTDSQIFHLKWDYLSKPDIYKKGSKMETLIKDQNARFYG